MMNHFCLIGLSHKTASIEVRERLCLNVTERELILSELRSDPQVIEAFVLSTCNRMEICAHLLIPEPAIMFNAFARVKRLSLETNIAKHFYIKQGNDVIRHLFEVACGLDSLVLGEKQILGQVKEAIMLSREKGMFSKTFNILFHLAVRAGKKAQHDTEISNGGSSVSWAAITMSQKVLGTLEGKKFLIVGTGKMGQLATTYLHKKGPETIYLMNRTEEKALTLAKQLGAQAVPFWQLKEMLSIVDVCITAAGAPHYLIDKTLVEESMAKRKGAPLVFMDLSLPRNIHPLVAMVKDIKLFTIDDLEVVVKESSYRRQSAVSEVQKIIQNKIAEFYSKMSACAVIERAKGEGVFFRNCENIFCVQEG